MNEADGTWWWVSILDLGKPDGEKFFGVYVVRKPREAEGLVHADWIKENEMHGKFEAAAWQAPSWVHWDSIPDEYRNRRLSKEEGQMLDRIFGTMNPAKQVGN